MRRRKDHRPRRSWGWASATADFLETLVDFLVDLW